MICSIVLSYHALSSGKEKDPFFYSHLASISVRHFTNMRKRGGFSIYNRYTLLES